MATITYDVPDMSCEHCVRSLTSAIQQEAPGAAVHADLAAHTLTITGTNDAAAIERGIQAADYTYTRKEG